MIWNITLPSFTSFVLSPEPRSYDELLKAVQAKYDSASYGPFILKYLDAEEELINLCSAEDFETAILSAKNEKLDTLRIFVIPTAQNQINQNKSVKIDLQASPNNRPNYIVPIEKPLARSNRKWTTYSTNNYKNFYKTKLPNVNEAHILQKRQKTLKVFGKIKRAPSCPALGRIKSPYPSCPEKQELNISAQDLKSICLGFLEKFAEEKINHKVKQEIKDVIPVLIELLKEAWSLNTSKHQGLQEPKDSEKICCQCKLPAKSVEYICTGCLHDAKFTKEMMLGDSGRTYKSLDSVKLLQSAKESSSQFEAKSMNNSPFSYNRNNLVIKKRNSKRFSENYKVSLLRLKPSGIQKLKPQGLYKVTIKLENCGNVKWPDNVKLVCLNGLHKGNEKMLPALEPGRSITIDLSLQAPKENGKYLSQWRVAYGKGQRQKSFGECLYDEILVTGGKNKVNVQKEPAKEMEYQRGRQVQELEERDTERKMSATSQDSWTSMSSEGIEMKVPKKIRCQEDRMKCARFLNEIFPGDLEEKINFIKKFLEEVTIFDVVEKYLMTLGKSRGRDGKKQEVH